MLTLRVTVQQEKCADIFGALRNLITEIMAEHVGCLKFLIAPSFHQSSSEKRVFAFLMSWRRRNTRDGIVMFGLVLKTELSLVILRC